MLKFNRRSVALLALAATTAPGTITVAHAETETISPGILITGSLEPLPTREVTSSYTIITAKDIEEHQYQQLSDALKTVPGLHIVQSGARGTQTSIFMRGANSNQTLVMMNGLPLEDPSSPNGAANISNISLSDVERIEVVRGPQSGLYGSQAIGGVINIITKSGKGAPSGSVSIEGGTLGTLNSRGSLSGAFGDTSYYLSAAHEMTDGSDITPARLRGSQGKEKDGSHSTTLSGNLGHRFSENVKGSVFAQFVDSSVDIDEDGSDAFYNATYENRNDTYDQQKVIVSGDLAGRFFDGKWRPKLTGGYLHQQGQNKDAPDANGSIYSNDVTFASETVHAAFDNTYDLLDWNTLSFGGSYRHDEYRARGFRDFGGGYVINERSDADADSYAVYAGENLNFADQVFLNINLRYDMPEDFGNRFSYTIAPAYYIPETDTRFTLSYGTGFKAPSLYQLHGFSVNTYGVFVGNPNLKPETSRGWDVGIAQGFDGGRIMTGVTWFQTQIDNPIVTYYPSFVLSTTRNDPGFLAKGVEAYLSFDVIENVSARIDYTYTLLKTDSYQSAFARRPRHKIGFTANWQPLPGTSLATDIQWIDPYRDIPRDGYGFYVNPAPYTVVNISGSQKLTDSVTLTARVNNLLDRKYEPAHGFLAPGIEALAGITVAF